MLITFVMLATIAANLSVGSTFPSWYPSAHAIPALVVATAFAPTSSKTRALPASQTFGRMSRLGSSWSLRNVVTKFFIILVCYHFGYEQIFPEHLVHKLKMKCRRKRKERKRFFIFCILLRSVAAKVFLT